MDRILEASSLTECQRHCDSEPSFHCKSVNYDATSRECSLSSEDMSVVSTLNQAPTTIDVNNSDGSGTGPITLRSGSTFSEKGNCEQG